MRLRSKKTLISSLVTVLVLAMLQPTFASAGSPASGADGLQAQSTSDAWATEWLEAFDEHGNRIEDGAESISARRSAAGKADSLVPVLVWFRSLPADLSGFLAGIGAASDSFVFK